MSLLTRLQKVKHEMEAKEEVMGVSDWRVLNDELITFGKAKRGHSFLSVFEKDPGYVEWFISHCSPPSQDQRRFHMYLELRIQEQEEELGLSTEKSTKGENPASSKNEKVETNKTYAKFTAAKTMAKPAPKTEEMIPPSWETEAVVITTSDKFNEIYSHMSYLEHHGVATTLMLEEQVHRTSRMEMVMEEMVNQMRNLSVNLQNVKTEPM